MVAKKCKNINHKIHNMKKQKNTLIISVSIFLLFFVSSCDNRIDLKPTQLITDEVALQKLSDYQSALVGAYAATRGMYLEYVSTTDFTADDVKKGSNTFGQGLNIYNMTYSSNENEFDNIWASAYSIINRCNQIITRIPTLQTSNPTEEASKQKILGEAIGLRAMVHFDLLRLFAVHPSININGLGIPYVKKIVPRSELLSRNTIQDVLDQVLADLNQAELLIPMNLTSPIPSRNYLSRPAIKALKARYYLYIRDYTQALFNANEVISTNTLNLATPSNYAGIWTDAATTEEIFKIKFLQGQGRLGYEYWQTDGDVAFFAPTNDLLSSYNVGSPTVVYPASADIRTATFFGTAVSGNVIKKHQATNAEFGRVDIKWIRLSEMYLISAEAAARNGETVSAKTRLAQIRGARITGYNAVNDTELDVTGNDLIDLVIKERRKELCYEGHRFLDLKRLGLPLNRLDCNAASSVTGCFLAAGAPRFTYPIPQNELNANRNMQQNPGY